jgi:hypothetical protein
MSSQEDLPKRLSELPLYPKSRMRVAPDGCHWEDGEDSNYIQSCLTRKLWCEVSASERSHHQRVVSGKEHYELYTIIKNPPICQETASVYLVW